MLALIILTSIILYFATTSVIFSKVVSEFKGRCPKLNSRNVYENCYHEHGLAAFGVAIIWPVTLPGFLYHFDKLPSKTNRDEKSRVRELANAEHRIALAKAEAERIRILEREVGIF